MDPEILGGYALCTEPNHNLGGEPKPCEPFTIELCVSGNGPVRPQDVQGETFTKRLQIGGQAGPDVYGAAAGLEYTMTLVEGDLLLPRGGRLFIIVQMGDILSALGVNWQQGKWYGLAKLNTATVRQSICCTPEEKLSWERTGKSEDELVLRVGGSANKPGIVIAQAESAMAPSDRFLANKKLAYHCGRRGQGDH